MSVPRYWRNEVPRYRLVGEECALCGNKYFPARPVCSCGATEFKDYSLAKKGEVVTWTIINNAPIGFEKYTPYMVAMIELEDGVRIISQLVDISPEDVSVGLNVEACFRKVKENGKSGILQYGYKFRPNVE
jgi:uncharacterized OB-fold protein